MRSFTVDTNIVLIGMPGVGKSTVGVLVAKALTRDFLDTDVYLQAEEGRLLHEIIAAEGREGFCAIEEHYLLSIDCTACIIATGGSAVYSEKAMEHLRAGGIVVFLDMSFDELARRVEDLGGRGVVMAPGQTFLDLYSMRTPLYRRYADITVSLDGLDHTEAVAEIERALQDAGIPLSGRKSV